MFELIELLKKFEDDFSQHIHSLYLIGSRADGTYRPDSDYDIVCLTTPSKPYSVSKMMVYEFHKMGIALHSQVEPFIIPVNYFLEPQHFASYDFLVRVSLKDHGKCLHGDSVIPKMESIDEKELFNFRFWMCLVMYNNLARNQKPTLHFMISFLSSLSVLDGSIPPAEWVSKRRLVQSIPSHWPEGENWLLTTQHLPLESLRTNLLKMANSLIEKNLNKWELLPSLSFTKPLFEFEKIALEDKFLFNEDESTNWNNLKKHEMVVIEQPFSRLLSWWKQVKRH